MRRVAKSAALAAAAAAAAALGAAAFVYSGWYDISATDQHTPPVYAVLEIAMRQSVRARATERNMPDLTHSVTIEAGFRQYQARCVQCHGAPGIAPGAAALGMTPVPGYLVPTARLWTASEIYWVVKHGIKMTGMPAWKYRMTDEEIWQVVAFVHRRLPYLSAAEYRDMVARLQPAPATQSSVAAASARSTPNVEDGRRALHQYACATCHVIPGITGATRQVGPPLAGIGSRRYIAGVLPNTTDNLVRWIMSPQAVDPLTAMPDLGVPEHEARHMAVYLAALEAPR